jgi:tRNA threonylcarbamoyladenosine biosynthesis protein TsaE
MNKALAVTTSSPEETRILGASLAPLLVPGDVLSLNGDLGAGKTVFVQGLASALGVEARVTSPTFTLIHEYDGRYPIRHLDVYRLDHFQEVLDLGFEELLDPASILVVEWGEAVAPLLPRRFLEVELRRAPDLDEETRRDVRFKARGPGWDTKLESMRTTAEALLNAASTEQSGSERFSYVDERHPHGLAREHMESKPNPPPKDDA